MQQALSTAEQATLDAALVAAIKSSDPDSVIALLERGADPNTRTEVDPWGFGAQSISALTLAVSWFCRRETIGFDSMESLNAPLVRALIVGGASLNKASQPSVSPMFQAVLTFAPSLDRLELVTLMLDHGADVDQSDAALCQACIQGDKEMVLLLLDRGASVNSQDMYRSPLLGAVNAKQKEIVAILLARGADVEYRAWDGQTALSLAKGKRGVAVEIRKMLEAAGAKRDLLEEECKQLIRIVEKTEDLEPAILDRWAELRRENLDSVKFNRTRLHHAQLLCRLGSLIAAHQNDFAAALDLIDRLLLHPKAKRLASAELLEFYADKLYYLLLAGEEFQAIALARQLMTDTVNGHSFLVHYPKRATRDALEDYFEAIAAQENPVSRELTELAWNLSQQLRQRPLKTRRLPEQAAPQALYKLMRRRG